MRKVKVYFGPTRLFEDVFKAALTFSVYHHKNVKEKADANQFVFNMQQQPLFDQVLTYMVLDQSLALKHKAKILVPSCAVLIGVIDQTGYLKEGEVFVQIRPDSF